MTATTTRSPASLKARLPTSLPTAITTQPPQGPRSGVQRPCHQHYPVHLLHLPYSETQGVTGIVDHQGSPTFGISWAVLLFYPLWVQSSSTSIGGMREHQDVGLPLKGAQHTCDVFPLQGPEHHPQGPFPIPRANRPEHGLKPLRVVPAVHDHRHPANLVHFEPGRQSCRPRHRECRPPLALTQGASN